ncbi:MaoC family dehydratase [Actinomadura sp. LD22]|uniref:MaoC family dehydratase n=1 Tax=Actinomadura physcomitrii TaxID=2650748 RepID=A0A6I4MFX3_9ACTN|nr:MaoC family dehydratase N-terminal domain-containing protein [Actinomadura physcomitrii]MWA02887.1 MaoC family dehydratase [Actinomadura physcomitrii]
MAIDIARARALRFPSFAVEVERGRLRMFARSIGETDPVYTDVEAAQDAGHRDLPVPPTFFFSLGLEAPDPFGYLDALGVDRRRILHGRQRFEYARTAYAGDTLVLSERITDVTVKRGGAMELLEKTTDIRRGGDHVARARAVIVVRHPEVSE